MNETKQLTVTKRNGKAVPFSKDKIITAINKALQSSGENATDEQIQNIISNIQIYDGISVEEIQEQVQESLMKEGFYKSAAEFIKYREKHRESRFIAERLDYMEKYSNSNDNAATSSETDANANVTMKNVANLEGEVYKTTNRIIQRQRMKNKLNELFPEVAKQYEEDINGHEIYVHNESTTPTIKQYCMAVSLYPLMLEGVGNIDGITPSPPNDIQSFSGQLTNLIFLLSSQAKGAVACAEWLVALNFYIIAEYGKDWYNHLDDIITTDICKNKKTIRSSIYKAFKQFIYGINQPAGNRSYQSPFVNISYYDNTYFSSLFKDFYYPDGTQPEWKAIDILQRLFMKFFNKLRTTQILTFPVETMAMVYDPKTQDIIDKEYKEFTAEMYAEGHSFFTYISDSADSLSSCCFSKDTKILCKSSKGIHWDTFENIKSTKTVDRNNFTIFHNGSWCAGKLISLSNRPMYKIVTANNKEIIVSDNHLNPTLRGDVYTSKLTTEDYLLFNTNKLDGISEKDEHLTYAQGFMIGAFLGDGSFGTRFKNGTIYDINFSQNAEKYQKCIENINKAASDTIGFEKAHAYLDAIYNNVYPIRVSSKELVAFIQKWTNWHEGTTYYNKELNMECLLQSYNFRKGILDGWYNSDGGNSNRCYTTSEKLKDCMEVLITSLGLNSVIDCFDRTDEKIIIRGVEYNRNYPLWCVRWYDSGNKRSMKNVFIWRNNSIYFKIKSIEPINYKDSIYCCEMKNQNEPYFTLPNGIITHNCRLKNELTENTFSPTSGLTGVMTGSCNVITLNINRIIQNCFEKISRNKAIENWKDKTSKDKFVSYLISILERVYKYQIAYKTMLYEAEAAKMFASSNGGYISISKLYSTIGVNGLNEAARYVGLDVSNNPEYIKFLQLILGTIKAQNKLHSIHDISRPFIFNSEVVPAESLGDKNYQWDLNDNYWVPDDINLYNSYFYNAHDNTSVLDKFILHGRQTYQYTDGGSAIHCNLQDHLSKEQYLKLIDFAIKNGTSYFTFNIPNSKCDDCGYITKHPTVECPKCKSKNITQYSRVIGYLRPISAYSSARQIEASKRVYHNNIT